MEPTMIIDKIKPKQDRKKRDGTLSDKMIIDIGNKNKEQLDSATRLMMHLECEQIYKDAMDRLAKEKDDQIKLALANIRAAMVE